MQGQSDPRPESGTSFGLVVRRVPKTQNKENQRRAGTGRRSTPEVAPACMGTRRCPAESSTHFGQPVTEQAPLNCCEEGTINSQYQPVY